MTNVTKTPEKKRIRRALVAAALAVLEREGWKVARVKGSGKSRVRRISKNGQSQLAVIRTSQDRLLAFPRNQDDTGWLTLDDVQMVVAAVVDDPANPKMAWVHMFPAAEMRDRFDRAYAARRKAGHLIPVGRGLWLALYDDETRSSIQAVGAGAGSAHPPIARVPLDDVAGDGAMPPVPPPTLKGADGDGESFERLTIPEAKRRLARTLDVPETSIRISIDA
ncbi:MAG: hypothetical protein V7647_3532 [Acidobacteriota bacterium]|jgi:hypothetical protein